MPWAVLTIVLFCGAESAWAKRVAIVGFEFVDTAPALRDSINQQFKRDIERHNFTFVSGVSDGQASAVQEELVGHTLCRVGPCLKTIGTQLGADMIITGGIAAQGSNYDITISMLDAPTGNLVAQVTDRCNVCTFDEAAQAVSRTVSHVCEQSRQRISDGQLTTRVAEKTGGSVAMHGWIKWALFGLGIAGTAAAAPLLALNENCINPPLCTENRHTMTAGIALVTAALSSLVLSGYLFWR